MEAFTEASLDSPDPIYATVSFPVEGITPPQIVLFKKFDDGQAVYSGSFDIESDTTTYTRNGLEQFVMLESLPSAMEFLPDNVPKLFNDRASVVFGQNQPRHLILFSDR